MVELQPVQPLQKSKTCFTKLQEKKGKIKDSMSLKLQQQKLFPEVTTSTD